MRLGVEVTTCTASRSGVGYYTEHLVDGLLETCAEGDEIVLLSNRPPAAELAARWSARLRVGGPRIRALWMQSELPRMLAEAEVDVAVFPNYVVPLASPCPSIVVVHDLALLRTPHHFTLRKRLLLRGMLRQSVASASVIGTVSETSLRDVRDLLGVDPARIALLPCAAHPSCEPASDEEVGRMRREQSLDRPYVLTVGTLEPRKNLLTVLRAWERLGLATHDLVVAGGRGWHDRRLVTALEAARRHGVRWLGYVSERDLVALYTGADAFVFAPTLEGFGMPILEAMACGAPVVASDIAAHREVGGDVPSFAAPLDDAGIAEAIRAAIASRDDKARRNAGLLRAKRYAWTETALALWSRARGAGPIRRRSSAGTSEAVPRPATLPPPLHPAPSGLSPEEWALLATVVYADLFDAPLPLDRAAGATVGFVLDEAALRKLARGPGLAPHLKLHPNGMATLTGRGHLLDKVAGREAQTRTILAAHRARLMALTHLPFVRAVLISGGIAQRNPGAHPDVDLFVVAARGRAYTAYTMFFLATKMTGTRRFICPNYLVDEGELEVAYNHDLFTAHQLLSCQPFWGSPVYEEFCEANQAWVRRFFPAFGAKPSLDPARLGSVQRAAEIALEPLGRTIEAALRAAWRFRLRRRAATSAHADLVLADGVLKLHLSDYRAVVLERFAKRLDSLRAQITAAARAGARSSRA
jgi:glycosyltransferase involved in cell wall biosynthesis